MGKKRFFDDRLKYLSFIQNTEEKKSISEEVYPFIRKLSKQKSHIRILDAGTGDGTINSNLIKSFHKYHPKTPLFVAGKEISYEDLKNTLEKMADRFAEHPNLFVTMTNVKFSEIGMMSISKEIKDKKFKEFNLILNSNNSFDFNSQITNHEINNFIKENWGIEIDSNGRTSYSNPCIIRIYRRDHQEIIEKFMNDEVQNKNYDLILASQAYRAASSVKIKVNNVIGPLMKLLDVSGTLVVTHSSGGKSIQNILKLAFKDKEAFPNKAKDIINYLSKSNDFGEYKYKFSDLKKYDFKFKKAPNSTITELFGHDIDAKWANILYVGQIPGEDIENLENNPDLFKKVRKAINNSGTILFENEIFSITRTK